jgi:hypothetical protein
VVQLVPEEVAADLLEGGLRLGSALQARPDFPLDPDHTREVQLLAELLGQGAHRLQKGLGGRRLQGDERRVVGNAAGRRVRRLVEVVLDGYP